MNKRLAILVLPLGAVLALAAQASFAFPISRCQCTGGIDRDNRSIPVSETYCGYRICGLGNQRWECTEAGWQSLGSCGAAPPECAGGQDQWGKPIHPNATYSFSSTCGKNYVQRWVCNNSSQWQLTTPNCSFCELCRCYGGRDQNNNLIPPGNTSCGSVTLGVGLAKWQCTAGGWEQYANAGVATNNTKFGINSAVFINSANGAAAESAEQITAQTYRMGWHLMMIGDQAEETQIDFRIATPIQNARNRGITAILRLCTGSPPCNYQSHPERLVQILNNAFLRDSVTGPWFVIVGPNEPPTEKWMTPETQAMAPGCGPTTYCDAQLDTIAREMAIFADAVMDNMLAANRQPTGDIGLLSPAWDCHNANTPQLMIKFQQQLVARGRSMTQFDGIAVNAYDNHNLLATNYIANCKSWLQTATGVPSANFKYYVTETGMIEIQPPTTGDDKAKALARDNLREAIKALRNDPTIRAALLFNATGRNAQSDFQYNVLRESCEWQYITGGHAQQ